jgi:hypothetical protein
MRKDYFLFFSFLFYLVLLRLEFLGSLRGITEGIERESHEDRGMKEMEAVAVWG